MLGVGIWVTTQDTEYKHLAGNLVSLICSFCSAGSVILAKTLFHQNTICGEYISDDRSGTPVLWTWGGGGTKPAPTLTPLHPAPPCELPLGSIQVHIERIGGLFHNPAVFSDENYNYLY